MAKKKLPPNSITFNGSKPHGTPKHADIFVTNSGGKTKKHHSTRKDAVRLAGTTFGLTSRSKKKRKS